MAGKLNPHKRTRRAYRRVLPLPEAVTGGKSWKILPPQDGETPHVVLGAREMVVPLDGGPMDAAVRLHEMAHARWTPVNAGKLGHDAGLEHATVNACEDARIHRKLADAGLAADSVLPDEQLARYVRAFEAGRVPPLEAARLFMASIGTADEPPFHRLLDDNGLEAVRRVTARVWRSAFGARRPAFKRTLEAATELESWFPPDADPDQVRALSDPLAQADEDADEDHDDGSREGSRAVVWGVMKMEEPPRVKPLPAKLRRHKRRALQEGSTPRHWHRLPMDGAVFGRKVRKPAGAAVLIDQSGSMRFSPDDVLEILEAAPAAIVAAYAGDDGSSGVLRILAKDGKRVADEDAYIAAGGNTVDGPALVWLAAQPGPRYWISDGHATSPSGDAIAEAARLALRGKILRVPTLDDLLGRAT
ncbi:MAG TPA: hypothetical protein VGF24_37190 [Vicinamibacterales bacterium]|jgi:hypothetical protein